MYELYIQDTSGTWQLADLGASLPAINIQRNDIGEMKDRQTDYSQTMKLPKSPANCRLFSFINEFATVSELRHRRMNCRLYADGYTIVGYGAYIKFVSVTDTEFNVQIVGALGSFFKLIEKVNPSSTDQEQYKLNDLPFTEVINRGYNGMAASTPANVANRASFFAIADFQQIQNSQNDSYNKSTNTIQEQMQYPFVKLSGIINQMLTDNGGSVSGYTLESDITSDIEYTNACIPFDSLNPDTSTIDNKETFSENVGYLINDTYLNVKFSFSSNEYPYLRMTNSDNSFFDAPEIVYGGNTYYNLLRFNTPAAGIYSITISFNLKIEESYTETGISAFVYIYKNATETDFGSMLRNFTKTSPYNPEGDTLIFVEDTYEYDLMESDKLSFRIVGGGGAYLYSINSVVVKINSFKVAKDSKAAVGIDMPIKGNLPDITQYDFFKAFLQQYGLTVSADIENKKIYAYTLNYVAARKQYAPDWSQKYNKGSGTVQFTIGSYTQTNQLEYKEFSNSIDTQYAYTEISEGLAEYMHNNSYVVYYAATSGGDTVPIATTDDFVRDQPEYWIVGLVLNDGDLDIKSKGYIYIDDNTLDDSPYTLFDSIFKASENNTVLIGSNRYRYAKLKRISSDATTYATGEDPTLLLFRYSADVNIQNEEGAALGVVNMHFVSSVSPAIGSDTQVSMEAQALVSKYYEALQKNVLSDVRLIEDAEFYLTPKDIQEYDPFTPVYIDTFGAYFYINKIKNFVSGKLTKVDLVKI